GLLGTAYQSLLRTNSVTSNRSAESVILYLTAQLGPAIESVRIRSSVPRYRPDGSVSPAVSLTSCGACKLTALVSMSCTGRAPADWRRLAQKLSCCPPHDNLSKD